MRQIKERFIAGNEVTFTESVVESDGKTPFDGSLYEVIGTAKDVEDATTTADFVGTIDSIGNFTATLTSATTIDLGGRTMAFDVWIKSGPFQRGILTGFLVFAERVTP